MNNKLEDIYLKKSTFLFFAIATMAGWIGWSVSTIISANPVKLTIFGLIFFILTAGMTLSYLKCAINIQKMLFGSILIFLIIDYIEIVEVYITYRIISSAIIMGLSLAILIVFYICHAIQQLDHSGRSLIIVINQCCGIIILLCVVFLTNGFIYNTIVLTDYTFSIAMMCTMFLIICMETRINKYKQIRAFHKANNDWDESFRAEAKKLFKL